MKLTRRAFIYLSLGTCAGKMLGHRQVTDTYLLGLAFRHGGKLATLDRGMNALLPDHAKNGVLEIVS